MSKRWMSLVVTILSMVCVYTALGGTTVVSGTFVDAQGNPLNGYVTLQLPVPAQDVATGVLVQPTPVQYQIVGGFMQPGPPLYDVAGLQPANLYYITKVFDTTGSLVLYGNFVVTGASFNLGAATPTTVTTSNISYLNPAGTNVANVFTQPQTMPGLYSSNTPIPTTGFERLGFTDLITWYNGGPILSLGIGAGVLQVNGFGIGAAGPPCAAGSFVTQVNALAVPSCGAPSAAPVTAVIPNSGTGTATNGLTKLAGAQAQGTAPADTNGAIGVCTSGCGAAGSATVALTGSANCNFDGATTAGDYVTISPSTFADCHDAGSSPTPNSQLIGRVLSSNGGAGTYAMLLNVPARATYTNWGLNSSPCATTSSGGATCTTLVNLNVAEPDTNYKVSCTGVGINGYPFMLGLTKGLTSVTVTTSNGSSSQAQVSSWNEIDCVVTR
jgi:hypothetical protein